MIKRFAAGTHTARARTHPRKPTALRLAACQCGGPDGLLPTVKWPAPSATGDAGVDDALALEDVLVAGVLDREGRVGPCFVTPPTVAHSPAVARMSLRAVRTPA